MYMFQHIPNHVKKCHSNSNIVIWDDALWFWSVVDWLHSNTLKYCVTNIIYFEKCHPNIAYINMFSNAFTNITLHMSHTFTYVSKECLHMFGTTFWYVSERSDMFQNDVQIRFRTFRYGSKRRSDTFQNVQICLPTTFRYVPNEV